MTKVSYSSVLELFFDNIICVSLNEMLNNVDKQLGAFDATDNRYFYADNTLAFF
jgi:hypothetical protein